MESVHPAVIAAAGLNCDTKERRAWVRMRYKARNYHPLPVYFAETFHEWNKHSEEERSRQIALEIADAREGAFTMMGAGMGGGFLKFKDRFTAACGAAVSCGDHVFFKVFSEVYHGLANKEFDVQFSVLVLRTWEFLRESKEALVLDKERGEYLPNLLYDGDSPTPAAIREYLDLNQELVRSMNVKNWPKEVERGISRVLADYDLAHCEGQSGRPPSGETRRKIKK